MPKRPELPVIAFFESEGVKGHYIVRDGWLEVHIAGARRDARLGNSPVEALLPFLKREAVEEARRNGLLPKAEDGPSDTLK